MSPDELVYMGILAASIPVGFLFRYLSEWLEEWILHIMEYLVTNLACC